MNYSLMLLIIILLMSFVLLIVLMLRIFLVTKETNLQLVTLPPEDTKCAPNLNSLIDVSSFPNCPNKTLNYQGTKYIPSLGYLVSLTPVNYIGVCSTACTLFDAASGTCVDPNQRKNFDNCVSLLQPLGCTSIANPIAKSGTNYVYANFYGPGNCFANF